MMDSNFNTERETTEKQLIEEINELREQLQEAQDVIEAIRSGEVDALAVHGPNGSQVYTLKGADDSYRILIEEMNEGAIMLNDQGVIVYSNACFANFIKYPLEKVIGASFFDFISFENVETVQSLLKKGWSGKSKGEVLLQDINETQCHFSIATNAFKIESIPILGVIITDVSAEKEIQKIQTHIEHQNEVIERKNDELKKEKAENESLALFRFMLESIPQISWTNLPKGEVNFYNQRWYEFSELSFNESKNDGWKSVIHPDDLQNTLEKYNQSLETGKIFEVENRYRRGSDGAYRWHLNRAVPIRDEKGDITLWIGTATDIHDQKTALEDIGSKNEELVRVNDLLDTFVFAAAHDLKSPVINIQTLLTFVNKTEDPARKAELLNIISTSVNRLDETINGLVDVIEVQSNRSKSALIHFDKILRHIVEEWSPELEKISGKIEHDFSLAPSVQYLESFLLSIIRNLVSNAIKYHNENKKLTINLTTRKENDYTVLEISDTGIGMDLSRFKSKLFKPFTRFTKKASGKGIGLYLIKTMVERNQGKIEVDSRINEGTVFKVYLKEYKGD
ncbi:MAG TPA: ATP-binding protein [Cytophagales bacterium]|nr:ATP-binding protein [Cytophagales bacterium]